MKQIIPDTKKMVQKETGKGMVSPPKVASKDEKIFNSIQKTLALSLPCEEGGIIEVLCDDCPFNIVPKVDCGLAILQERAKMIKLEMEKDE